MEQFFKCPRTLTGLREGPLGAYLDSFAKRLHDQGYARLWARVQIRLIGGFSQWLKLNGILVEEITSEHTKNYLQYRSQQQQAKWRGADALRRFLDFLSQEGAIAEKRCQSWRLQLIY